MRLRGERVERGIKVDRVRLRGERVERGIEDRMRLDADIGGRGLRGE